MRLPPNNHPNDQRRPQAAAWLRNAQIAVSAFMSVAGVTGLCYVFYSAFVGNTVGAVLGAIVATGGVSLGFLALAAVRFGELILARTDPLDTLLARMEARMDALESTFEAQGIPVDLARVSAAEPDRLVAAQLERDVFPRLAKPGSADGADGRAADQPAAPASLELAWQSAYQNGDVAGCRRALDGLREFFDAPRIARMEESLRAMSQAKSARLREEFAQQVRERNYEAALLTGDEIARAFPESSMAREFESLRPHLQRRAQQ